MAETTKISNLSMQYSSFLHGNQMTIIAKFVVHYLLIATTFGQVVYFFSSDIYFYVNRKSEIRGGAYSSLPLISNVEIQKT